MSKGNRIIFLKNQYLWSGLKARTSGSRETGWICLATFTGLPFTGKYSDSLVPMDKSTHPILCLVICWSSRKAFSANWKRITFRSWVLQSWSGGPYFTRHFCMAQQHKLNSLPFLFPELCVISSLVKPFRDSVVGKSFRYRDAVVKMPDSILLTSCCFPYIV